MTPGITFVTHDWPGLPLRPVITSADLETVNRATVELYSPELQAGNWLEHAFRFLTTLVSADMMNYGALDLRTQTLEARTTCDRSFWPTAATGFATFMQKYPYFSFDATVNEGKPFFRSDFITARQFRDTDIYYECFRLLETMDHAAIYVPTDDGCSAWFAAERGRRDFDDRDRLMLTLGQSHLSNSRQLALSRQKVRDEFPIEPASFCRVGLTPRESEVGYWVVEGKSNAEIAAILRIQTQTVKSHISTLFNKTGTGNRLALALHLMDVSRLLLRGEPSAAVFAVRDWKNGL